MLFSASVYRSCEEPPRTNPISRPPGLPAVCVTPGGPTAAPRLLAQASPSAWTACPLMFSQPADSSKPTTDPACLEWFPALKIHKLLHHIPKNTNLCMYTDGLGDCPLRITLLHYYKVIYFSVLCSVRLTPCNEPMERMVRRERNAEHRISNTLSCYLDCRGWAEAFFLRGMQSWFPW